LAYGDPSEAFDPVEEFFNAICTHVRIACALMSSADEMLSSPPSVESMDVLAMKNPLASVDRS
jgi:hypothetical protein